MSKAWWTAHELALQTLPGLPTTKRKVNEVAAQQGWASRINANGAPLARARKGRGGGQEYHYTVLPTSAVAALVARGEIMSRNEAAAVPQSEAWAAYDALPDTKKAVAVFRKTVLEEVEALQRAGYSEGGAVTHVVTLHSVRARQGEGEHHAFGASTVRNWKGLVKGLNRGDWLPALAPRTTGRTATAEVDPEAWEFLKGDYMRLSQPSFESVMDRLLEAAGLNGWKLPSAKTLKRKLDREIPEPVMVLAREGYEKLERMFPPMIRDRSEFHALQAVNADGHRWDVFVQFPDRPKPQRPLMLAIQDLYSGKILAWRIAENEGADTVRLAFGDLFRDHGVPDLVWLDNGRGFASKWITGGSANRFRFKTKPEDPVGVLTALGCDVRFTRPYSGRSKPIERAFRTLCDHGAKHPEFQGAYTGNSPMAKPEDYASRAVPLDVFTRVVADVIRRHNAKPNRNTRVCRGVLSYDAVYEASLSKALIRRATEAQLRMCLLAHEAVTADTPADVDILYQAVAMIGTDCAAVIPEFMNIDFVQAPSGAGKGADLYERWCDWLDRQVSKAVLGQSGTADANTGSGFAQAKVLDGVREDLRDADARQLARTIRRDVIEHYVRFNYGPDAPVPLLKLQTPEAEDLKNLADALGPMIDRGLKVKASQVRGKFNLDTPDAEDEVLQPLNTAPAAPATTVALNRRTFGSCGGPGCEGRALNRAGGVADQVDLMTAEAVASWSEQMAPIIEPIQRLAQAATSYEEFLAGLDDALIQGDATALAKALGSAMFKARALGDVRDDA